MVTPCAKKNEDLNHVSFWLQLLEMHGETMTTDRVTATGDYDKGQVENTELSEISELLEITNSEVSSISYSSVFPSRHRLYSKTRKCLKCTVLAL